MHAGWGPQKKQPDSSYGDLDENGNLVTGLEKIIEMRLRDMTLEHLNRFGVSVKSTFDVQPGAFLVRVVVRDSEGAQMAAVNRGVVIPY